MGLISQFWQMLFGDGRNIVAETAEVFRENAEKGAMRAADARNSSLNQFGAEFALARPGLFDQIIDGVNRLPRPALALGTIYLFVMAMAQPERFASGMAGLALVPDPLWWLMGAIVSFYFGARQQVKTQEFQRSILAAMAMSNPVQVDASEDNPALTDWQKSHAAR